MGQGWHRLMKRLDIEEVWMFHFFKRGGLNRLDGHLAFIIRQVTSLRKSQLETLLTQPHFTIDP